MKIIKDLAEIEGASPCSLALGAFDGLHLGHLAVVERAVALGTIQGLEPAVFTFPQSPHGEGSVIMERDKERLLEEMGIRRMYSVAFSRVRNWTAKEFAREWLFSRCAAKQLCCGEDFRFGKGAQGEVSLLRQLCGEAGSSLTVVSPVLDKGEKVSSTRIRRAIKEGKIPLANRLLGRPFGFSLEVIHGNHIGTGLGTPTINQALPEGFVLPRFGVYASWARVAGEYFYGVTNIGLKPTVGSDRVLSETWLPDFQGDLYGKRVRLFLLDFIRPERKFASLEELKCEIQKNAGQASEAAKCYPPPKFGLD